MDRPSFACRRAAAALGAAGILALAWPSPALAQFGSTGGGRRTTGGRTFPSWEQDDEKEPGRVLPVAAPGHHEVEDARPFGEPLAGVAGLLPGGFAAALKSGRVAFFGNDLEPSGEAQSGFAIEFPPVAAGGGVVVSGAAAVALVEPGGTAWTHDLDAPLTLAPVAAGPGLLALAQGSELTLVSLATGATVASAKLPGTMSAGPAVLPGVLIVGTAEGQLVGIDAVDGRVLWSAPVLARVDALVADADAVHAVGEGVSSRARRVSAPSAIRLPLGAGGRTAAGQPSWRLRLGADSVATPILMGQRVLFASGDGFIHAVDRVRGSEDWRTDLPARARSAPVLAGGRLDFVLAPTAYVVALAAENGAVMGGTALTDEDETFVGAATQVAGRTVAATSLGRVVFLSWRFDELLSEKTKAGPRVVPAASEAAATAPAGEEAREPESQPATEEPSDGTDG